MTKRCEYINYKKYSLRLWPDSGTFDFGIEGYGWVLKNAAPAVKTDGSPKNAAFKSVRKDDPVNEIGICDCKGYRVVLGENDAEIVFRISDSGLEIFPSGELSFDIKGLASFGNHDQKETMAVCIGRAGNDIRVASGPAASSIDNALFDKDTDAALVFGDDGRVRLRFDWSEESYTVKWSGSGKASVFRAFLRERVYEDVFHIAYKRQNENSTFKTPPVGWMTWYAVKFNAGEKTVLENAEIQRKFLKPYGADTIWVDWEWYHRQINWTGAEDVDMYHPDQVSYPGGLKKLASDISGMGFIPALWVGPVCDPSENEIIKQHPEAVAVHKTDWCGQYFFDITHPVFLNEALPKMIRQPLEWGYRALKWDCMPITQYYMDEAHDTLFDENISTREAMRRMFAKAREIVGKDYYMLYCCSLTPRDIDLACSEFDGVRIGNDIFKWEEFTREMVDKIFAYYSLHNVMLLTDPDNVVIRDEYNHIYQSQTRAAIVSLLGMPFTLGDDLTKLDEEHLSILKRSIPPIPYARPMDIRFAGRTSDTVLVNLAVERPFGRWNVAAVINLKEEKQQVCIDLNRDLHIDESDAGFCAYDFWNNEVIGVSGGVIRLDMQPCQTRILSVVNADRCPKVLSTSRHISHGAIDLECVEWDEAEKELRGKSRTVIGDDYSLVIAAPSKDSELQDCFSGNMHADMERISDRVWRVTWKDIAAEQLVWTARFS